MAAPTGLQGATQDPIARIDAAIAAMDFSAARTLASGLCERDGKDVPLEQVARATLRLAGCDYAASRLQRARESARRAAHLLEKTSYRTEEVDALALAARASALQGRVVEAVELARLAGLLSAELRPGLHTVRSQMALGASYAWASAAAQAREALETAAHAAASHAGPTCRLEVGIDRLWCEALRQHGEISIDEHGSICRRVDDVLELWDQWDAGSGEAELVPGSNSNLALSAAVSAGIVCLRIGRGAEVPALLARADALRPAIAPMSWLAGARIWLLAELAHGAGDGPAAAMHAARLRAHASEIDVPLLETRAHALAANIATALGRAEETARHLEAELALQRRLLVRQLEAREKSAEALWSSRQSEELIQTLAEESTTYWKWAHEDALTGIANLRRFNQCMTEWTAPTQDARAPLFVAVIDVDRFKSINDDFSHDVGDLVLKEVARQMSLQVRESDLAARWGGDEFAILFREVDLGAARTAGERLQHAVRDHDWSEIRTGLRVGISVGVVEARPGESKRDIRDRADQAMYEQKRDRRRAEAAQQLPPRAWFRATAWLRAARRVVVLVGSAGPSEASRRVLAAVVAQRPAALMNLARPSEWPPHELREAWQPWRTEARVASVPMAISLLPGLAELLPEVRFITERIDGSLAQAGIHGAMELYGNGFRDRCANCGLVWPSSDAGFCLSCAAGVPTIRPDVVMPGEKLDHRLQAAAKLAMKRADLVLAIDCDGAISPTLDLIQKARLREARIVALGACGRPVRGLAHLVLDALPAIALEGLIERLKQPPADGERLDLSGAGVEIADFLGGQGPDDAGVMLEQALAWRDHEIDLHQSTLAWMFPLPTRSRVNPLAPSPTVEDFALLACDEQVRQGMRRAFERMLRYYGFDWRDGRVVRAEQAWEQGFSVWVLSASAHDLYISRILGALRHLGLSSEASAFLRALTPEVERYRGAGASAPLRHWRREAGETMATAT